MHTLDIVPSTETAQIIDTLKNQANQILGPVLSEKLSGFGVTQLGNFPYFWQNPSNLQFNGKTYAWISSNLAPNPDPANPVQFDQTFPGLYIEALAAISFQLSKADQAALNQAQQNATNQQLALLNSWIQAFGALPPPAVGQKAIDTIMTIIATTWASPSTSLFAIQQSTNLHQLLNQTPASGQPILPVLANYLNALGSSISLQNSTAMNTGYLAQALAAVQRPSLQNGGLQVDDNTVRPSYAVSTQLSDIINGLSDLSNAITLTMSVARTSSGQFTVSVNGGASFDIPIGDLFGLSVNGNASYFQDKIATSSNMIDISMTYTGVTMVNFGPVAFDLPTGLNWYWLLPITEAIKNGSQDITGFKFSPDPHIDFTALGNFAFLTGAAISNYPSITIRVTSADFNSIATTIQQSVSLGISFLGISLGGVTESTYSHNASSNSSTSTVTITLNPPPSLVAGTSVNAEGWVLGVETSYPAANAAKGQ